MGQKPLLTRNAWASEVMSPMASALLIRPVQTGCGTLLQRTLMSRPAVLHMQNEALVGTGYVTGHVGSGGSRGSPQPGGMELVVERFATRFWVGAIGHTTFAYAVWTIRPSSRVIAIS